MKNYLMNSLVVASLLVGTQSLAAVTTADEIVKKIDLRLTGDTSQADLKMVLEDKRGNTRVREMRSLSKKVADRESMIMFFKSPTDVRGTAYLSVDYKDSKLEDDTWLYLSAMRRNKRVANSNKSDAFMGSDFSYSDVTGTSVWDWNYQIVKDSDLVDGADCWVLESTPKDEQRQKILDETGYNKRRVWVRKDSFYIVRAELSVAKDNKVKLMKVDGLHQVNNIWTASQIQMVTTKNNQMEHRSSISFSNVNYNLALDDKTFTTAQMEQGLVD